MKAEAHDKVACASLLPQVVYAYLNIVFILSHLVINDILVLAKFLLKHLQQWRYECTQLKDLVCGALYEYSYREKSREIEIRRRTEKRKSSRVRHCHHEI